MTYSPPNLKTPPKSEVTDRMKEVNEIDSGHIKKSD
jgi:hypothetical protein